MTDLHGFGFTIADLELSHDQCSYIATSLPSVADQRGGSRGLLAHPTILQLIRHRQLAQFIWSVTGRELVAVAARLLDSAAGDGRELEWHQDCRVAVRERMDVPGYGPWTSRVGIWYVEPPSSVLSQMIVVRLHLDECASGGGGFQILPGSHRAGKLTSAAIRQLVETEEPVTPQVAQGTLMAMRPLLLHSTVASPSHYRVLHIEFAPLEAISPLQWLSAVNMHRAA